MTNELIDKYKFHSELGRGGMATVYLAEHQLLYTQVAIKVLNDEFVRNTNIRNRFLSEARKMARMNHPNIIKVTDLIEEGDTVAFVMEYIEGETLKEYLDHKGKLDDAEIKNLFSQMLDALDYVHEQNLVHRDIKPSNFMLDKKGKVKLMDFGIAKTTDASSAEYTQTGTGIQMGTPMYMSPEQITETKSVTAQSDIYSLGVVLWQMVMGQKPYDTKTLSRFQLESKIVNEPLLNTMSSWELIIRKATDKDTQVRYKNVAEFFKGFQSDNRSEAEDQKDATVVNGAKDETNMSKGHEKTVLDSAEKQTPTVKRKNTPKQNEEIDQRQNGKTPRVVEQDSENRTWILTSDIIVGFIVVIYIIFLLVMFFD